MRALAIAATGMNAQQTNVEVIANNIANINTTGFKRARAEFSDLLYQTERAAGRAQPRRRRTLVPEGAQIGLGVAHRRRPQPAHPGCAGQTGNQLDLALNGRGWFQIAGAERRDALHARRRLQQERHRPDRDRRRLRGPAGDDDPDRCHRGHRQRDRARSTPASAAPTRRSCSVSCHGRQFRQRCRPRAARRQSLSRDHGVRPADVGRAGRSGLRHDPAGLSRELQRRSRSRRSPS